VKSFEIDLDKLKRIILYKARFRNNFSDSHRWKAEREINMKRRGIVISPRSWTHEEASR